MFGRHLICSRMRVRPLTFRVTVMNPESVKRCPVMVNENTVTLASPAGQDVDIPDEVGKPDSSMTFGVLKMAQTLGDKQALQAAGRRVIRFHLGDDVVGGLALLSEALA